MSAAHPKLGIRSDDLRVGARRSMDMAARSGFGAIELGAISGELTPENLSSSGRRHVVRHARHRGLHIAAVGGALGSTAGDVATLERHLSQLRNILELARDLHVNTVTTSVGLIGARESDGFQRMREALVTVAEHADLVGRDVALTTAGGPPAVLAELIEEVRCERIKVCYDPGELLIGGHDPLDPVERLADHIGMSHLRDAMAGGTEQGGRETALGHGQLNIAAYLGQLAQAGYHGPQILRRAQTPNAMPDLTAGLELLSGMVS